MIKSLCKICLCAALLLPAGLNAQSLKFAHINSDELVQAMPEAIEARKILEEEAKGLENQLKDLQDEYNKKLQDYVAQRDTLKQLAREAKEEDLNGLGERIQSFRNTAQQKIANKEKELLQPIFDKARKAIEDVAKEQGVIYVFEESSVLYKSTQSIDLLPFVKKKLGIQ
ncbi:MAG: OmpH family outer membrane protein [Bacteroidales bacterium]|jgi:outer membrane protein|nr:OmpH family outer membrane protein [Bacteroidales bacterium]